MLKLELPAKTWFQGSQDRMTGGLALRKGRQPLYWFWFTHII